MPRSTLIRAPPVDPSKSPLENSLELTTLSDIGPVSLPLYADQYCLTSTKDIFTNTRLVLSTTIPMLASSYVYIRLARTGILLAPEVSLVEL